jgi:hypothetical protein
MNAESATVQILTNSPAYWAFRWSQGGAGVESSGLFKPGVVGLRRQLKRWTRVWLPTLVWGRDPRREAVRGHQIAARLARRRGDTQAAAFHKLCADSLVAG